MSLSKIGFVIAAVAVTSLLFPLTPDAAGVQLEPSEGGGVNVVGGGPILPGEYPFFVSIGRAARPNSHHAHQCGGTIVAPNWVVTAAHCRYRRPQSIAAGRHNFDCHDFGPGSPACTSGTRIDIETFIPHPNYDPETLSYDFALVKLATPVTIPGLEMATSADAALMSPGTLATVIGLGVTDDTLFPRAPHEVGLTLLSDAGCETPNTGWSEDQIHDESMLCAGELPDGGADSCSGDSGGPLIVPRGTGWLLVGVASWGSDPCGEPLAPGVYAEVAAFEAWITSTMLAADAPTCGGQIVTIDMNTNGGNGQGTKGSDVILGTNSPDLIDAKDGLDVVCGQNGGDEIKGGPGDDLLYGGPGADTIYGAGGADVVHGEAGPDALSGGGGADTIFGGVGDDVLQGNGAADTITGGADDDSIKGQGGGDNLSGDGGLDSVIGGLGPDLLDGGDDNDTLLGGQGADTLYGGAGVDKCSGNTGPDSAESASCEQTPSIESLF